VGSCKAAFYFFRTLSSKAESSRMRATDSIIKLCCERYFVSLWWSVELLPLLLEEFRILSLIGELSRPPNSPSLQLTLRSHLKCPIYWLILSVKILENYSTESRSSITTAYNAYLNYSVKMTLCSYFDLGEFCLRSIVINLEWDEFLLFYISFPPFFASSFSSGQIDLL
jgi:hypothetical protein